MVANCSVVHAGSAP